MLAIAACNRLTIFYILVLLLWKITGPFIVEVSISSFDNSNVFQMSFAEYPIIMV